MIISNKHKYIYLRVPRTGSTSVTSYIHDRLNLEDSIIHAGLEADSVGTLNVEDLLLPSKNINNINNVDTQHLTLPQIIAHGMLEHNWQDYSIYAICRDPVDRFKSFCRQLHNFYKVEVSSPKKQQQFLEYIVYSDIVFDKLYPQSNWLLFNGQRINKIYKYHDIKNMVKSIAGYYNIDSVDDFSSYSLRSSAVTLPELPAHTLDRIYKFYDLDFQIYNSLE